MKNKIFKVLFLAFFTVFSFNIVYAAENYKITNVTEKINDVYVVKYGTTISIETNNDVTIKSNDKTKAIVSGEKEFTVVGTGKFTININNSDIEFYSWNACLKNGKYWAYKDAKM